MMTRDGQKHVAVLAWNLALGLSIRSLPAGPERDALDAARANPNLTTVRAVLTIGRQRPWLPLIESALVEIGLAAVDDILEGDPS